MKSTSGPITLLAVCMMLGGYQAPVAAQTTTAPAGSTTATQPAATQPKRGYTSPRTGLTFLQLAAATSMGASAPNDAAREASQNAIGQSGLQNSVSSVAGGGLGGTTTFVSVGKQGLLQGGPLRDPLNLRINTLFIARPNPVAAGCQGLVKAGFFPTATACQARFRR